MLINNNVGVKIPMKKSFICPLSSALLNNNVGGKNSDEKIIHLSSLISSLSPCYANVGEALVAQLAVSLACSLNLDRFILKGDSAVIIQALNKPFSYLDWRISPIILESLDNIPSTFS